MPDEPITYTTYPELAEVADGFRDRVRRVFGFVCALCADAAPMRVTNDNGDLIQLCESCVRERVAPPGTVDWHVHLDEVRAGVHLTEEELSVIALTRDTR